MNGDLGFAIPIDTGTGGPAGEASMFFGHNGRSWGIEDRRRRMEAVAQAT
jgi:hypothetical protein